MEKLNIERIRQYNSKCNEYKTKLSNTIAERKIMANNLASLCEQLSAQLGIQVTPDNLEKVYEDKAQAIKQTLESGEEILKRIEGATDMSADEAVDSPVLHTSGFDNAKPINVTEQPAENQTMSQNQGQTTGQPSGFGKLPESTYKMPTGFGGNAFMQSGVFHGSFADIKPTDNGVDEI